MNRGTEDYQKTIIIRSINTKPPFILMDYSKQCVAVRCKKSDLRSCSDLFQVQMEGLFNNNLFTGEGKLFQGWIFKKDNRDVMEYFADIAGKKYEDFIKELNLRN